MTVMKASDLLKAADIHANRPAANAVPTGALYSCTTHNLIYRSDGSSWSTWATLGGSSGLTAVPAVKASRTAGDVTLNSTTFANIDTGTDLTIAATAGDIVELGMEVRASVASGTIYCVLDFHTIVSAAPVNSVSSESAASTTTAPGLPGWSTGSVRTVANGYTVFNGRKLYTVQAGDISGGNVVFRLRGFSGGSVTLAASDPRLYVQAVNYKH